VVVQAGKLVVGLLLRVDKEEEVLVDMEVEGQLHVGLEEESQGER
jgi:hypothetical protein